MAQTHQTKALVIPDPHSREEVGRHVALWPAEEHDGCAHIGFDKAGVLVELVSHDSVSCSAPWGWTCFFF